MEFLQRTGKDEGGWGGDDNGMVSDVEGMGSLGGTEMLSSMRDGTDVMMEILVEVAVVETVHVARGTFFVFFRRVCLGNMMGVRVVIEVVVGVVVLVWWTSPVV